MQGHFTCCMIVSASHEHIAAMPDRKVSAIMARLRHVFVAANNGDWAAAPPAVFSPEKCLKKRDAVSCITLDVRDYKI